ncbi:MAG: hypothetical protein R3C19_15980 [Planctomycetaceae bacterium]
MTETVADCMTTVPMLAITDSPALITFLIYMLAVFGLAAISSRLLQTRSFLSEYFLGSRSLGVWALALTFAATSASGGSFTGFPSLIYTHGWVLALWISSYMIFPLCTMGFLGKRLNQVARKTDAITVPDILRDRFGSPFFGLLSTTLIVFFMCVNLVGQFKAGSVILKTLVKDVDMYHAGVQATAELTRSVSLFQGVDAGYLLCLVVFGISVIAYTTWGGFHAVVWTDVMQGIVMVAGVVIMLPLVLSQVGGLENATRQIAGMVPPNYAVIELERATDAAVVPKGTWLQSSEDGELRIFRTRSIVDFAKEELTDAEQELYKEFNRQRDPGTHLVRVIEIVDSGDRDRILDEGSGIQFASSATVREIVDSQPPAFPGHSGQPGAFVTAPGPHVSNALGFLPLSLAFSFFFQWAISGTGQPQLMVRLMAFNSTKTLRMSIITVAIYFSLIYFPLVIIFCCARILLPGMEYESDSVMPQLAVTLTSNAGAPWLAGLLVAAPFAAVMSTVDSFLLMISSSVVRDIYQRNINPNASEQSIKRMSYCCTLVVGAGVVLAAMNPPQYLQNIIVYCGSGLAACFLAPVVLAIYWPRVTGAGAIASMLAGFLSHLSLYVAGWFEHNDFSVPIQLLNLDPVVISIATSFLAGFAVTLLTPKPSQALVLKYFYQRRATDV